MARRAPHLVSPPRYRIQWRRRTRGQLRRALGPCRRSRGLPRAIGRSCDPAERPLAKAQHKPSPASVHAQCALRGVPFAKSIASRQRGTAVAWRGSMTPDTACRGPHGCRQPDHSARSNDAVGVRAAMRPGKAATTLARPSAPNPMRTTVRAGTVGCGDDVDLAGEQIPQEPSQGDAEGHADDRPGGDRDARLPSDDGCELASGEPEGLEEREVASATADRSKRVSPRATTAPRPVRHRAERASSPWSGS